MGEMGGELHPALPRGQGEKARQLRGAAALSDMLDLVGGCDDVEGDRGATRILVDNEMELRALLQFALGRIAS